MGLRSIRGSVRKMRIGYNVFDVNYKLNIIANDIEDNLNDDGLIKRLLYSDDTLFTKELISASSLFFI